VPNNPALYDAAVTGFVSGVYIARDANRVGIVGAMALASQAAVFASAVDGAIAPGSPSSAQIALVQQLCQSITANKYVTGFPQSTFDSVALSIATLYNATSDELVVIAPPTPPPIVLTGTSTGPSESGSVNLPTNVEGTTANWTVTAIMRVTATEGVTETVGDTYTSTTVIAFENRGDTLSACPPVEQISPIASDASLATASFGFGVTGNEPQVTWTTPGTIDPTTIVAVTISAVMVLG
jgi:hypothetical protein